MHDSDLFDDLNRALSKELRITVEEQLRYNMKNKRKVEIPKFNAFISNNISLDVDEEQLRYSMKNKGKVEIPKFNAFISDNISLDVDEEVIIECKGKCTLLSTSMFIDNWIYIDEQGISYVYLNILCQYANNNKINTLIIPDFVDVIIINSELEIEYNGIIIFNENLKAITSYYEPVDKNYIVVSDSNIYFRCLLGISVINTLDFSKCKNIVKLVSGSFYNIKIENLIFGPFLSELEDECTNTTIWYLKVNKDIQVESSVFHYVKKWDNFGAMKIGNKNIYNISQNIKYMTNQLILDNLEYMPILKLSPIAYENFNTIYIRISFDDFVNNFQCLMKKLLHKNSNNKLTKEDYQQMTSDELAIEIKDIFKVIFYNNYKYDGKLLNKISSPFLLESLKESNISFYDFLYYCSNFILLNKIYYQYINDISQIISSNYKIVNILLYNGDIGDEIESILDRNYVLTKIFSSKTNTQYNFSIDNTLNSLIEE